MHLATVIFVILATWKWADWKNWQKYHTTLIFVALANLLYVFFYCDHLLWQFKPDILFNITILDILYTFVVFPCTALLLLKNYPEAVKGQILRIIKFIAIYIAFEFIFLKFGRMIYSYDWTIWWSLAWNVMMFPMWALHHKKPLLAYGASIILVPIMLIVFPAK